MPIFYSCIKIDARTTVEHAARSGNYGAEAHRVMQRIEVKADRRASYSADSVVFHVQIANQVLYMCVCDTEYRQGLAFQFLGKLKDAYMTNRGPGAVASLNAQLKREMETFNSGKGDKLQQLQSEIDSVKGIMMQNIDQLLERGERIDVLVGQTSELADQSDAFFDNSRTLRKKMWWKNVKLMLLIGFVIVLVIFVIVLIACGGFKFPKCKSDPPPPPPPAH